MDDEYQHNLNFKIVSVGEFGVGKTHIIKRFVENEFSEKKE